MFVRHRSSVRATLGRLGVQSANIDDAVQDVFVVVLRRIDDYDASRPLHAWLWGIARRVAKGYERSKTRSDRLAAALTQTGPTVPRDELALRTAAAQALDQFLDDLDPRLCDAFVLAEVHGLTGPEIAQRLGIKLNTAYSRLRHARARLERTIARVRARERGRWVGVAVALVARTAAAPFAIGLPVVVIGAGLVVGTLAAARPTSAHAVATKPAEAAACEDAIRPRPVRPWDGACAERRLHCASKLEDCRGELVRCEGEAAARLPWPLVFEGHEPNPAGEELIDPLLERTYRSVEGVSVSAECRGPICRLDSITTDTANERFLEDGGWPQERLQRDDEYREILEGGHFQSSIPTNDLVTGEGVWLETTWVKLKEDAP